MGAHAFLGLGGAAALSTVFAGVAWFAWRMALRIRARFVHLVELAPQGIVITQDDQVRYANVAAARLLGEPSPAALQARGRFPAYLATLGAPGGEPAVDGSAIEVSEFHVTSARIRPIWLRIVRAPVEWNGKPAVRHVLFDVTARKAAEATALERHRLFLDLMDALPFGVAVKDRGMRYRFVNRAWLEFFGGTEADYLGRRFQDLPGRHPRRVADEQEQDARVLASGAMERFPQFLRTNAQGVTRTMSGLKLPLRDEHGEIQGLIGVMQDISGELASQRLLEAVFNAIPQSLIVKDAQRRVLRVNNSFARRFGRAADSHDLIGNVAAPGMSEAVQRQLEAQDRRVLERGEAIVEEPMTLTDAAGKPMHLTVTKVPMRDAEGHLAGMLGVIADVTERVLAEAHRAGLERQLQQTRKLEVIGELAAGVAHDFNNLLTPILGNAMLLLRETPERTPLHAALQVIWGAAERASDLTRGLLALGRTQPPALKPVSLNLELDALRPLLQRLLGNGVTVQVQQDPHLGLVEADPAQIHQVLLNLAINARDAMPGGGEFTVSTANATLAADDPGLPPGVKPGAYVALHVRDTGRGMDEATRQRAFDPFFTTKAPGEGTGLGLSIVHRVVSEHRGHVTVQSAPGTGSTFSVYLPRLESSAADATPGDADGAEAGWGHRVLVMDEDPGIRDLVCAALTAEGYPALAVATPEDALDQLRAAGKPFALLITDLRMPGMPGIALADRAAAAHPQLKVLAMAGGLTGPHPVLATTGQALPLLEKPFTVDALVAKVRELLDAP